MLRWFGVRNQIVDDWDFKPSKFGWQFNDDLSFNIFNIEIGFQFKVDVNFRSLSTNFWLNWVIFYLFFDQFLINRSKNGWLYSKKMSYMSIKKTKMVNFIWKRQNPSRSRWILSIFYLFWSFLTIFFIELIWISNSSTEIGHILIHFV